MDILLSSSAWLAALWIFSLRVSDMNLDTLRLLFVVRAEHIVREADPEAFMTAEDVRPLRHGFWRA